MEHEGEDEEVECLMGGLKSWLGFAGTMTGTQGLANEPEKRVGRRQEGG